MLGFIVRVCERAEPNTASMLGFIDIRPVCVEREGQNTASMLGLIIFALWASINPEELRNLPSTLQGPRAGELFAFVVSVAREEASGPTGRAGASKKMEETTFGLDVQGLQAAKGDTVLLDPKTAALRTLPAWS